MKKYLKILPAMAIACFTITANAQNTGTSNPKVKQQNTTETPTPDFHEVEHRYLSNGGYNGSPEPASKNNAALNPDNSVQLNKKITSRSNNNARLAGNKESTAGQHNKSASGKNGSDNTSAINKPMRYNRRGNVQSGGMSATGSYDKTTLDAMQNEIFLQLDRSRLLNEKMLLMNQKINLMNSVMNNDKRPTEVNAQLKMIDTELEKLDSQLNLSSSKDQDSKK